MRAYHFLRSDLRTGEGEEPPWAVGEERSVEGPLVLCKHGYHYAPSWLDALQYAPGPVACLVDVDELPGVVLDDNKGLSRRRRMDDYRDVTKQLRVFACDCAERALTRERAAGREPDRRSWEAVVVARRHLAGEATDAELDAARAAARDAARDAAWDAARAAARDAAWDAARAAAWAAAWDAARAAAWAAAWAAARDDERDWQRQRLAKLLDLLFAEKEEKRV